MASIRPSDRVNANVRLVRQLGAGGMGSVWLAHHEQLNASVVVKFMSSALAGDASAVARFRREAAAASEVRSPHVVQVLDFGVTDGGRPYIVMELLEGEDLAARLERVGAMPLGEVAGVVAQVSKALARAHDRSIVHRDIKPENIFLCDGGDEHAFVKVLDFGIAKVASTASDHLATSTGAMIGSPHFMSPEQVMGAKSIDHRTDLWSLGVVAYFALTGVRPFDGETLGAISIAIVHQRPPAIRSFRPDLPAEIDDWFAKATAPAAADRFSTAKEMADALVALAGGPGNALVPARSTADAAHSRPKLSLAEASAPTLGKGDETALALARAPSAAGEDPPAPAQPSAATAGVAPSSPGPRRLMAIAALGVALLVGGVVLFMRRDGAGQDGNRSATNNVGVVASARVLGVEAPSASPGASIASPTTASPSAAASSASDPSSAASIDVGMRSGTSDAKPGQAGSSARPSIAGIAAPSTTSSNAGRPPTKPSAGRSASSATTPVSPRQHEEPLE